MDTLKEIYQKLIELWNSNLELIQQVKEWKQKISNFLDSVEKFFTIVPPEVILLLLCVALVMILLNSISPTTPRINLTIGIFIFGVIYLYVVHAFMNEWKVFRILYISSFVLVPAYFLEIFLWIKKLYLRYTFNKENLKSSLIKTNLTHIHNSYAEFVSSQNFLEEQPEKFFTSFRKLENSISELSSLLNKKGT